MKKANGPCAYCGKLIIATRKRTYCCKTCSARAKLKAIRADKGCAIHHWPMVTGDVVRYGVWDI